MSVLNNAHGTKLDAVGFADIRDNCFIGMGAIVMLNTMIGPNSVVAAGSLVTEDLPPGMLVGGLPAKVICSTAEQMERLKRRSDASPWIALIETRDGPYGAALEPALVRQRVNHFYGDP